MIPNILFLERPNYNRLITILWGEEPDRVPFYEHFVDNEVIEYVLSVKLRGLDFSKREHRELYIRSLIRFYKGLRYDYVPLEIALNIPLNPMVFTEDTARLSRGKRGWLREHDGLIKTFEDFENYPWPEVEEAADYDLMKLLCKLVPDEMGVVGGVGGGIFEHVVWIMGYTPLFRLMYRNRKLVEAMFYRVGKLITDVQKILVEYDKLVALRMGDDLGSKNGTFVSPAFLREHVFPWYRVATNTAHKHGKPFILHSCGNLKAVMEDIIETGIDAKHSFEDVIMPVTEAKKLYGDRISILGGVDVDKLARYPRHLFRDYVMKIIRECCPGGGYALGSGNTITNYVDLGNYFEMLKLGVKYGQYPKRGDVWF